MAAADRAHSDCGRLGDSVDEAQGERGSRAGIAADVLTYFWKSPKPARLNEGHPQRSVAINVAMMGESATSERELVRISGRGALVNIHIDDSVAVELACRTLRDRLARNRHLYADGKVVVDIGQRVLRDDEQERIRKVIEAESGLTIKQFCCDPSILARERDRISNLMGAQAGGRVAQEGDEPPGHGSEDVLSLGASEEMGGGDRPSEAMRPSVPADIVRGTCRAGEVLKFPGDVVVVGNVNPGAQIIAQGDVLVFGTLRGTVHAGAGGDSTAVILAMSSIAPQLRIGDYLAEEDDAPRGVAGRRRGESEGMPIIARVQNRVVRVSPYLKNHSIDHGGNPNER